MMYNLVGRSRVPLAVEVITDRTLNGRAMTAKHQIVMNNLFYRNEQPPVIKNEQNTLDHNVFVDPTNEPAVRQWLKQWGEHNALDSAAVRFSARALQLRLEAAAILPAVPRPDSVFGDFFTKPRSSKTTIPGPFQTYGADSRTYQLAPMIPPSGTEGAR